MNAAVEFEPALAPDGYLWVRRYGSAKRAHLVDECGRWDW